MAQMLAEGSSMTNVRLAEAFLDRARTRLEALESLRHEADFSDIIRESRDITTLCFRGMLRIVGVEVSRFRDVGEVLRENMGRLPSEVSSQKDRLMEVYNDLRRERPLGPLDENAAPVEKLLLADADRAISQAEYVLRIAQLTLEIVAHRRVPTVHA